MEAMRRRSILTLSVLSATGMISGCMNNTKMTRGGDGEAEEITLLGRSDLPGTDWVSVDYTLWRAETETDNLFQWEEQGKEEPLVASAILRSANSENAEQIITSIEEQKSENADINKRNEIDIADRGIGLEMTYGRIRSTEAYFRAESDIGAIMIREIPDPATDFPVKPTISQLTEFAESMY